MFRPSLFKTEFCDTLSRYTRGSSIFYRQHSTVVVQHVHYIGDPTWVHYTTYLTALQKLDFSCIFAVPDNTKQTVFSLLLHLRRHFLYKIQKHFQNVKLVGMASEISKNYTYKCVDRSRHNGIKGAKAKCAH